MILSMLSSLSCEKSSDSLCFFIMAYTRPRRAAVVIPNLTRCLVCFTFAGLGDCVGVFLGHLGFKAAMKASGQEVDMKQEVQTASHLGSAAAVSGFMWQPTLNALQALECGFTECMLGVGASCTLAFYVGLRVFRKLYGGVLKWEHVQENNYKNLKGDLVSTCLRLPQG
jgi:hypothetical protein